jgi:hypothetical protein
MELTYERYLAEDDLRAELERRAHRERSEQVHRYFAQLGGVLREQRPGLEDACHSYASR